MSKKPLAMLSPDELREYKKADYEKHKFNVHRNRLLVGLASGKRKPKPDTLKKYNIDVNDMKEIVVPSKEKIIYKISEEKVNDEPTVINIVRKPTQPRISQYNTNNTALTGEQLRNFVMTVLKVEPQKGEGSAPLTDGEIKTYANVGKVLFTIYGITPYDATMDLTSLLNNADLLIQKINENPKWPSNATKARFLSRILMLSKKWLPLNNLIVPNRAIYNKLDKQYNEWSASAKATQLQKSATTSYYSWDVIRDAVILKYGEESFPSLLVQLYEEIIARDDLGLTMAYKEEDIEQGTNYLLLNRPKRTATVVLTSYKTKNAYNDIRFELTKRLTNLIMRLKPPSDKSRTLFPIEKAKLRPYMMELFKEIPFIRDEKGFGIRYVRHSLISTKLLKLDPTSATYASDIAEIANKSMHSVSMQSAYKSPLKDKNGNPINTQRQADALQAIITTRSQTGNVFEKPVDKPKPKKGSLTPKKKRAMTPKPKEK